MAMLNLVMLVVVGMALPLGGAVLVDLWKRLGRRRVQRDSASVSFLADADGSEGRGGDP